MLESDIIYPNNRANIEGELRKLKNINAFEIQGKAEIIKTGLKCYWCGEEITSEDSEQYYKCSKHKHIFCDNCAKNGGQEEILRKEAPKCKETLIKPFDCIYNKIMIEGGKNGTN